MYEAKEAPPTTRLVVLNPNPYGGDERQLSRDPERLREALRGTKERLIRQSPSSASQIEVVYDLFWGLILLPSQEVSYLPEDQRTTGARIQQTFVHHAFYAGLPTAPDNFTIGVYRVASAMGRAARLLTDELGDNSFLLYWSGMRSELAIVKALFQNGYRVWLPDYALAGSKDEDEILQLDVRSGVDMIARRDGIIYLIDAKGGTHFRDVKVICTPQPADKLLSPLLQRIVGKMNPPFLLRAEIGIPSGGLNLGHRESFHGATEYREEMRNFCVLPPEIEAGIIRGLQA